MRVRHLILTIAGVATLATATLAASPIALFAATPARTSSAAPSPTPAAGPAATAAAVRDCAAPAAGQAACFALRRTSVTQPAAIAGAAAHPGAVVPDATPAGYGPSELASAYKYSTTGGSGQTVAIVDAYNNPKAASDLATYRSQYGLPACTTASGCFKQVNQTGGTSLPASNQGWAGEIDLDIQMVSAVCPNCKILLVEATSSSLANLYVAEDYAASQAKFVSNSWGGAEPSTETTDDAHFNHPGVAITASSGDSGYGSQYPAGSRYVTAVGGTSLAQANNSRGWTEVVWQGAGSGCSLYDSKPTWQTVSTHCTNRAIADVSADADPATGVAVYQTYGASGWQIYGGTSVASPIIASIWALAGAPGASDEAASYPYRHASNLFDVTSGFNGSCGAPVCTAGPGWDGPTGLGTPDGTAAFVAGTGPVNLANPGSQSGAVGVPASVTLIASGGTAPYTFSAAGLPAGLSLDTSTGVIAGVPTTAGTDTVTATVTDAAAGTSTVSFSWVVAAHPACTGQLVTNPSFEINGGAPSYGLGTAPPWLASTYVIQNGVLGGYAENGQEFAWFGNYNTYYSTSPSTLSQTVTLPAGCTLTLQFYVYIVSFETTATAQNDTLTASVGATPVLTLSNLDKSSGYVLKTVDISSLGGATTSLLFSSLENTTLETDFYVDNITITVS